MKLAMPLVLALLLMPTALGHGVDLGTHGALTSPGSKTATTDTPVESSARLLSEVANRVLPFQNANKFAPVTASNYAIGFQCPEPPLGLFGAPCPYRIADRDDVLGNVGLAVDPEVPGRIAFASLHGREDPGSDRPSTISRGGQTHTTFTTEVFGLDWTDQPYTPPNPPAGRNTEILGEDTHAWIDSSRTLHVTSLYAHRESGSGGPWNFTLVTWKFDQETRSLNYELTLSSFTNAIPGGRLAEPTLLEVPEAYRMALVWHETSPADRPVQHEGRNVTSWVNVALTMPDSYTEWKRVNATPTISPCDRPSNPVVYGARIYVACESLNNLTTGLEPGDIVLHAFDLSTLTAENLGKTPRVGPQPRIAINPDEGTMALMSVGLTSEVTEPLGEAPPVAQGAPNETASPRGPAPIRARITTSHLGEDWSHVREFGDALGNASLTPTSARINAILYRNGTNTIHFILREEIDERRAPPGTPHWRKSLIVVDPLGTVVLNLDLRISEQADNFFDGGPTRPAVFGDTRDSLIDVEGVEYIAFNDYSIIVYAGIVEYDQRLQPIVLQSAPPIPEPVAVVQSTVLTTTNGIVAASVAAAAAARWLALRRAAAAGHGRDKK